MTSCDQGQVESLCGKSLAHINRRQFMSLACENAVQSSWKVTNMCSAKYSEGNRLKATPGWSQLR